jgi:hypothetical protein
MSCFATIGIDGAAAFSISGSTVKLALNASTDIGGAVAMASTGSGALNAIAETSSAVSSGVSSTTSGLEGCSANTTHGPVVSGINEAACSDTISATAFLQRWRQTATHITRVLRGL